jgi:UMF1 family MFS transporter
VRGILARLSIARADARAWALYDWANSAFFTVIVTAVFPVYYQRIAGQGLPPGVAARRHVLFLLASTAIAGVIAPALGAIADFSGARKRMLAAFTALGVLASGGMFFVEAGDWLLGGILLALGNVAVVGALVCYDGLLTHVAREGEVDVLSTTGYGLGYLGGGALLALNLAWILYPERFGLPGGEGATLPTRLAFLSVAVWWAAFTVPLLLRVKEPPRRFEPDETARASVVRTAFRRLGETVRELRGYREAFVLLLGALIYSEGIGTIYKLATVYGADLQLDSSALMIAILLTQFVGVPFAMAFGRLAERIGARGAILASLTVYAGVCVYAYFLESECDFYVMAITVGMVQGGAQALTRSLFASMVPAHKSAEFFGLFAFASKLAGFAGLGAFYAVGSLAGSNRPAVLVLVVFFIVGGLILLRVDVAAGRMAARLAEQGLLDEERA